MNKNNTPNVVRKPELFPSIAIMKGDSHTASTAVSGAISGVIIVIQLTDKISNTCAHRLVSVIVVRQPFEAGWSAFADLSAFRKVNGLPVRDTNAKSWRFHSSSSSS